MSSTLIKNVRITPDKISFDYTDSNVFPQRYHPYEEENTPENWQRMKEYLIGRIYQPVNSGKRLYKKFGITHFYDGIPVN